MMPLSYPQNWTDNYVAWSPKGTYLATFHRQGIALWGGPSWRRLCRFAHNGVKLIDFSPNERYLVTYVAAADPAGLGGGAVGTCCSAHKKVFSSPL